MVIKSQQPRERCCNLLVLLALVKDPKFSIFIEDLCHTLDEHGGPCSCSYHRTHHQCSLIHTIQILGATVKWAMQEYLGSTIKATYKKREKPNKRFMWFGRLPTYTAKENSLSLLFQRLRSRATRDLPSSLWACRNSFGPPSVIKKNKIKV